VIHTDGVGTGPALYGRTGVMLGSLFAWPSFPARIGYDNDERFLEDLDQVRS
jgi:hypothetical protein